MDVLKEVRKALRALRRAEKKLAARERKQRQRELDFAVRKSYETIKPPKDDDETAQA